jgi:glycosyltransferase involved in cell wall biosynthesis
MAQIRRRHPQAHCVVVGGTHDLEPGYADAVERQVASLGLDRHVTFAGLQANVPDWMHAMDVVVHASDREPFGIVVIEAMALGKPVVAGSEGGPREIVTDGVDGLLVAYGDSAALAAAVRRYLEDPEFAKRVGTAARRRAAHFAGPRYAQNVITALRDLAM